MVDTNNAITRKQYPAQGFSDSLSGGKSSGVLSFSSTELRFVGAGGEIRLPLGGLQVRLGGASDRLVFFEHPRYEGVSVYSAERSVLKDAHLGSHPALHAHLSKAQSRSRRRIWVGLGILGFFAAIPIALILAWSSIVALAASHVPESWESAMGEAVLGEFAEDDYVQMEELDRLGQVLIDALITDRSYDYQFYVIDDETLNAFAAPGGVIMVHTGLIENADSAEELMGVLAHEISHVTEQHGLRGMINSLGWLVVLQATLGDASGLAGIVVQSAPFLIHQQYSQGFEEDADENGVALLQRAQVDPDGLGSFFERLLEEESHLPGALGFLSSHPATSDRIEHIESLIDPELPIRTGALDKDFTQLRKAVQSWQTRQD